MSVTDNHDPASSPLRLSFRAQAEAVKNLLGHDSNQYWIVIIFAVQAGALTLAIPLAAQTFVNTVTFVGTLQPILYLSLILMGVLSFSVALQVLQYFTVEKLEQRLFGLNFVRFVEHLPATEGMERRDQSEKATRYWLLQSFSYNMKSIFIEGLAILLQMLAGLILIAFYHPWLLVFGILLCVALYVLVRATRANSVERYYLLSGAKHDLADFAQEQSHLHEFQKEVVDTEVGKYLDKRQGYFKALLAQKIGLMVIYVVGSSLLLGIGGILVVKGQLALGQLVASEIVISALLYNISSFGSKIDSIDSFFVDAYKFSKYVGPQVGES